MKRIAILTCILLAGACCPKTHVSSPDGRISVRFSVDADGVPTYAVDVDGEPFLESSAMGLFSDDVNLDRGFRLKSSRVKSRRETWHQPWGENKEVVDNHKELALRLKNDAGVGLEVFFRVFDDGFGFRYAYEVPGARSSPSPPMPTPGPSRAISTPTSTCTARCGCRSSAMRIRR